MTKFMNCIVMAMMIGFVGDIMVRPNVAMAIDDNEINKILKAKEIVRGMVNYPDTLVFHEFYTKVSGNTVTLKFTAKNGFGVPETFVKDIKVNQFMDRNPNMIVLDQDAVEILSNENLFYKPYLLRLTNYNNERYEMRLSRDEIKGLADFLNQFVEDNQ